MVEAQGGEIRCQSQFRQGSNFTFTIPLGSNGSPGE
jgi:signal transduction histidine kinase